MTGTSLAPATYGLTPKQRDALDFIDVFVWFNGHGPSLEEIAEGADLSHKSNAHGVVACLVERGWITFLPNRARSITALKSPPRPYVAPPIVRIPIMGSVG